MFCNSEEWSALSKRLPTVYNGAGLGDRSMNVRGALLLLTILAAGFWIRTLPSAKDGSALAKWWPWERSPVVTLYFSDGAHLFPVSRRIPATHDLPHAALQALLDGPPPGSGLKRPIPQGARIRSVAVSHGIARVDLSETAPGSAAEAEAAYAAMVYTMTRLPGVTSVAVTVDGKAVIADARRMPLLYYASPNGLVGVPSGANSPRESIAKYMAGPADPTVTGVPHDVRLVNYAYDAAAGLVSLDFSYTESVRTLALEKPHIMRSVLLGIVASLTEIPGVQAVRIDFEGHSRLGLGECSDLLRTPQPRPQLLNDERLLGA